MRLIWLVVLVSSVWATRAAIAAPALPPIDQAAIAAFLANSKDQPAGRRSDFERDLANALRARADVSQASAKLARKYRLSVDVMERFAGNWVLWVLYREQAIFTELPFEERKSRREALLNDLRVVFLGLVKETDHADLVLVHAATALRFHGCRTEDFHALVDGASDRVAVARLILDHASCTRWWIALLPLVPDNPAVLWNAASPYGRITRPQEIALLERLAQSPRLTSLSKAQRLAFRTAIARHHIGVLWDAALTEEGLDAFAALEAHLRQALLTQEQPDVGRIMFDGFAIDLTLERMLVVPPHDAGDQYFQQELAAAFYAVGRDAEARAAFEALPFAKEAEAALACRSKPGTCRRSAGIYRLWYVLNFAIARADEDPYGVAEFEFGSDMEPGLWRNASGTWARVLRRLLAGENYAGLRERVAQRWPTGLTVRDEDADVPPLLAGGMDDRFRNRVAELTALVDQARARVGADAPQAVVTSTPRPRGTAPGPAAFRFTQHKIELPCEPPAAERPKITLDHQGYSPVRVERRGKVVVVVSLSQNFDPTGEISGGGYWIHVSRDGGQTWERPLYTGLAQYFPYVVVEKSCKPMWAGDHLEVEVEVNELDLESITYPPVGLQTKRREKGLYLVIPFAVLKRDSDRDLLTDIEEEHILLDPKRADTDADGSKDGVDPIPNVPRGRVRRASDDAMEAIVEGVFGEGSFGGIVEGIREPGQPYWGHPRGRDVASRTRPMFVVGQPADFASLRPARMMLVYSRDDIARIETMTPVFSAVRFGPLTLNRAGTVGFATWNAGWVGGTLRATREGDAWRVERISGWIT